MSWPFSWQVERVVTRVSLAVKLVFGFTLTAGVMVLLATQLLDLAYQIRIPVWLLAIGIATVAIATVGMLSIRDVLRQPAWASLKYE